MMRRLAALALSLALLAGVTAASGQTEPAPNSGGGLVYVANHGSNTVSVVDPKGPVVIATVAVGASPTDIAFTPDGSRAYVSNLSSDSVSVIDTRTRQVVATVAVGDAPAGLAASPDGTRVYVTNTGSGTLSVIDTATSTVVRTVVVGGRPRAVAVMPDGTRVVAVPGPVLARPDSSPTAHVLAVVDHAVVQRRRPVPLHARRLVPDGRRHLARHVKGFRRRAVGEPVPGPPRHRP